MFKLYVNSKLKAQFEDYDTAYRAFGVCCDNWPNCNVMLYEDDELIKSSNDPIS